MKLYYYRLLEEHHRFHNLDVLTYQFVFAENEDDAYISLCKAYFTYNDCKTDFFDFDVSAEEISRMTSMSYIDRMDRCIHLLNWYGREQQIRLARSVLREENHVRVESIDLTEIPGYGEVNLDDDPVLSCVFITYNTEEPLGNENFAFGRDTNESVVRLFRNNYETFSEDLVQQLAPDIVEDFRVSVEGTEETRRIYQELIASHQINELGDICERIVGNNDLNIAVFYFFRYQDVSSI